MTSLTPQRDTLTSVLDEARAQIDALALTGLQARGAELAHAVLRAALLPVAEMLDDGVSLTDAQALLENAIASLVVSNALSHVEGNAARAETFAGDALQRIASRVARDLQTDRPDIRAYRRTSGYPEGRA